MILFNHWNAVIELIADGPNVQCVILQTNGVDLFHIVAATVFTHLAAQGDSRKGIMKELLKHGFAMLPPEHIGLSEPEFWHRGGAGGETNPGAIRKKAVRIASSGGPVARQEDHRRQKHAG